MDMREGVEDYEGYLRLWKAVLLDGIREAVKERGGKRKWEERDARTWVRDVGDEVGTCRWVCKVTGEEYGQVVAWVSARGKVGQRRQYRVRVKGRVEA